MNNIFILSNEFKDPSYQTATLLQEYLRQRNRSCEIGGLTGFRNELKTLPEDIDLCVVLGGDGTLMEAASFLPSSGIPVFGVNIGTLGYLTEVSADGALQAMEQILNGDYLIEKRMMIDGTVCTSKGTVTHTALNDIVLARYGGVDSIDIEVRVNDAPLCAYRADGVILSTPTGSTAYNMSAGGPIATPTAHLILMTPVAPHNLTSRSIVMAGEDVIELTFLERKGARKKSAEVCFDAGNNIKIKPGESVRATRSDKYLSIVRLHHTSFMDTLHNKLA